MAKATEKYEVMYIINPNFTDEQTAAVVEVSASSLTRSTTFLKATMC